MKLSGIHHVAYRCEDAKETVNWYGKYLNMDFVLAIAEDEVPSTKEPDPYMHVFLDAGNGNILAFFELPTQPNMGKDPNTPVWVQHLALKVDSMDDLFEVKARLEADGIDVLGPTDHTIFKSIYFFDPSGHRVELAVNTNTPEMDGASRCGEMGHAERVVGNQAGSQPRAVDARRQPLNTKHAGRVSCSVSRHITRGEYMSAVNETHDPERKSWVESANAPDCSFPIQNLPYGVFDVDGTARVGVAIGDEILNLAVLETAGLLPTPPSTFSQPSLNAFMALGSDIWRHTRKVLSGLLSDHDSVLRNDEALRQKAFVSRADATLHLPFRVAGYTDFYAGRQHAFNVGSMFRDPANALPPNWLHIPIGYNGRASTVVVSGTPVRRPLGQTKAKDAAAPSFGPCRRLDLELEFGTVVGTPNELGAPISLDQADEMIFGYVLLNDWSARDIQVWEYQPLGPFQSKVFATSISPWVVTAEALEPFRTSAPDRERELLPYLRDTGPMHYDINLEVSLQPESAEKPTVISRTNTDTLYYSAAQQLTHHAVGGCRMETGDLLGSGTISGPDPGSYGSLLELSWNAQNPLKLDSGEERTFLEDGDTLTLTGYAQGEGYRIGFGECTGTVLSSPDAPGW